jgi:hypothetical protein
VNKYKEGTFFSYKFVGESSWNGYEHNCLFANVGSGQFVDVGRASGADALGDARAVAIADLDGDGRLDLAINNNNSSPIIYLNRLSADNHYLRFQVLGDGERSNRDAVGARVALTVAMADGTSKTMTRWVEAGSGYAAQSDFPLHFGLADAEPQALEITWPSGSSRRFDATELAALGIDHVLRIEEGAVAMELAQLE